MLALGGGEIAAVEFRIALGLGATVGVLRGSGREADLLLQDRDWAASERLKELERAVHSVTAFVSNS